MSGYTVTVWRLDGDAVDEFGAQVGEWTQEAEVPGVLLAPASTADLAASIRPDGDSIDAVAHFPRTYTASLRSRRVRVLGRVFDVVGDPICYDPALTPTPWNRPVNLKEVLG